MGDSDRMTVGASVSVGALVGTDEGVVVEDAV